MKKHHKCDTDKYRRRRKRERLAHAERVKRRQREEYERALVHRQERERLKVEAHIKKKEGQRLVQVLANHLYTVSPKHAREAMVNEIWSILNAFSSKVPHFPNVSVPQVSEMLRIARRENTDA